MFESAKKECRVHCVTFEIKGVRVSDERDRSDQPVLQPVEGHGGEHPPGHVELPCAHQNGCAQYGSNRVSDDWYESEEGVRPDSHAGSRQAQDVVQHVSDLFGLLLLRANHSHI
jgi:hypothetical protein